VSSVFRALAWGVNSPVNTSDAAGAVLWLKVRINGRLRVLGELAFQQLTELELANQIAEKDRALHIADVSYTVASPEIFPKEQAAYRGIIGEYVSERLSSYGVSVIPADPDELNGWSRVQSLLRVSGDEEPLLTIDPSCEHLVKAMGMALSDDLHPDLTATYSPLLTALRFAAMSRPSLSVDAAASAEPPFGSPAYYMKQMRQTESGSRQFGRIH
jgi:hypothetical protein